MTTALAPMPAPTGLKPLSDVVDVVQHLGQLWDLANILIKSRMLPASIQSPEAAVAIMLKGRELGIGAMASFAGITVIQGKPVVSPQLMLSLINRSGVLEDMRIEDDGTTCRVTMKRHGRAPITGSFSMEDARLMQLASKDNWKKMPAVMRQWRAVAATARIACPDVIDGMYTPEEMGAEVNEDGEILEAQVVEHRPSGTPKPANKGLFTKASVERTREFLDWLGDQCRKINDKSRDEWVAKSVEWLKDGHAVPASFPDVINKFQAKGHLLKWAKREGYLPEAVQPDEAQSREVEAHLAALFFSEGGKDLIKAEMAEYLQVQRGKLADAIYRQHPDIAPDGWQEEQDEANADADKGDAYEAPEEALA